MNSLHLIGKTLLVFTFSLLLGCSSSNADPLAEIKPQQTAEKVETSNAIIIDVRTQEEWDAGRIPGAIHIPLDEVKNRLAEFEVYKDQPIIMQCRSGRRSAAAGNILLDAGYDDVANLTGGIIAWKEKDLSVAEKLHLGENDGCGELAKMGC